MTEQQEYSISDKVISLRQNHFNITIGLYWAALLLLMLTYWVNMKHGDSSSGWIVWGVGLVFLGTLATAIWQSFLTRIHKEPAKDKDKETFFLNHRRLLALVLLGLTVLLFVLALILAFAEGLQAFPEVSSAVLLCLIGLGGGWYLLSDPEKAFNTDAILEFLVQQRQKFSVTLMAIGGICFVIGLWWYFTDPIPGDAPIKIGVLILGGLVILGGGLWLLIAAPEKITVARLRALILSVGGSFGFLIAVSMAIQAYVWRNIIVGEGMETWQGPEAWKLWLCIYLELVGLGLIFASFLLGRMDIRVNPTIRRLLYGYNAVLTGLLLLAILVMLNIVVYALLPYNFNWSASQGFYSLSNQSKKILDSLDDDVEIWVLMSQSGEDFKDVQNLLENVDAHSNKVTVNYVSPELNPAIYEDLVEDYPKISQVGVDPLNPRPGRGILLAYGPEAKGDLGSHSFIPSRSLNEPDPLGSGAINFVGEKLLMTEVRFLAAGQQRPVVYFSQGNGEWNVTNPNSLRGMRFFADHLRDKKYDVRVLRWGFPAKVEAPDTEVSYSQKSLDAPHKIPSQAEVLIIAGPEEPFEKGVVEALDDFMQNKGRLILLSGNIISREGKFVPCGLEDWLTGFGVELKEDLLLTYYPNNPLVPPDVAVGVIADEGPTVLSKGGLGGKKLEIKQARTVQPKFGGRPGFRAAPLIEVFSTTKGVSWSETDPKGMQRPRLFVNGLRPDELKRKIVPSLPVAVTVTDNEDNVRMIIYGDHYLIYNPRMLGDNLYKDLMYSSVAVMADRPEEADIGPKETTRFRFERENVSVLKMVLLPFGLMVLGIVGLGAGIWLTRRR